ncbi:MAG: molybdenum cofactor biosynthesis protein MoaB [Phycisphaerales bacterium]|nr:molybdenum cofactor biosynthesis protein MoaB [Phycisphaerales bacterium]MCI0675247.1 molybdenum cofactor biosynthesis protein MoaB [Phycisphaerales bacterium]
MAKSSSSSLHQKQAREEALRRAVRCAVLTVSDTRTMETDTGGPLIQKHLEKAGHQCAARAIVRDEPAEIEAQVRAWLADASFNAILITGGTGISQRDTTIEVVRRLLTVELEGFGELFRMLSYQEVGAAAMLSRAVAGLVVSKDGQSKAVDFNGGGTFLFVMPGSPNAVEMAMDKLIAPQLAHLVWERRR